MKILSINNINFNNPHSQKDANLLTATNTKSFELESYNNLTFQGNNFIDFKHSSYSLLAYSKLIYLNHSLT